MGIALLYVIVNLWYPLQMFLRVRRRVLRTTLAFQFLYLATAPRWHLWTVVCVTAGRLHGALFAWPGSSWLGSTCTTVSIPMR